MAFITTTADNISSGGAITGDLTIEGDLTVDGGGGFSYSEVLTGDMKITNAGATIGLEVNQTGNATAMLINQDDTDQVALEIDTEATGAAALYFNSPANTNAHIIHISGADALTTGSAVKIGSGGTGLVSGTTGGLVEILHTGDSDVNANNLLFIQNNHADSSGTQLLKLDQNANAVSLDIDSESTSADVINITSPATTTGYVIDVASAD